MARSGATLVAAALLVAATAAPAQAVPDCAQRYGARTVLEHRGLMETVFVDGGGRVYFGDLEQGLFRMDELTSRPERLWDQGGSGLAWGPGNRLTSGSIELVFPRELGIVGLETQPAIDGALTAAGADGRSTLWLVHGRTGRRTRVATGLSLANGVAYDARERAYYATNHEGAYIVRVQDGVVDNRWALVPSANGLVLRDGWLYTTVTFGPPLIRRVRLDDPSHVETYATGGAEDAGAALDGLRDGGDGVLYAAAHGSGEVWRVDAARRPCALVRGLDTGMDGPSDVAVGRGPLRGRLYVTTFSGKLLELSPAKG